MKEKVLREIRQELKSCHNSGKMEHKSRNDKEKYGIKTPIVRKTSSHYFKRVKSFGKEEIFMLAEELLRSGANEEKTIAFDWIFRLKNQYLKKDFLRFERLVKTYIMDWWDCDDFCTHAVGEFLVQKPSFVKSVNQWSKSKKWAVKRASAVSLIYGLRRGLFLKDAFNTSML